MYNVGRRRIDDLKNLSRYRFASLRLFEALLFGNLAPEIGNDLARIGQCAIGWRVHLSMPVGLGSALR